MIFWIGGEVENKIYEEFRISRNLVEEFMNTKIINYDFVK